MKEKLQSDISYSELTEGKEPDAVVAKNEAEDLVDSLDTIQAQGRMVIDLDKILSNHQRNDLVLRDGDMLFVPQFKQEITVVGEVQYPTSHIYNARLSVEEYIDQSGGFNLKADRGRLYVVKANGRVYLPKRNKWFRPATVLEPGDTVVVPLDAEARQVPDFMD